MPEFNYCQNQINKKMPELNYVKKSFTETMCSRFMGQQSLNTMRRSETKNSINLLVNPFLDFILAVCQYV